MPLSKYLIACSLGLAASLAHAETFNGLYQVSEPVASQAPEERNQAIQHALETLVLRLTGDTKAFASPGLAAVRQDPQQIITRYGYDAGPPEALKVEFDPTSTERSLRQAGLALWGENRPSILAWWLNEGTDGPSLIGDGQGSADPLRRAARHRGLPLRLPLGDLSEQLVANAQTLEGSDKSPLQKASERYDADALLAVHASEQAGQWQGKWQLWLGNQHEQGTAQGADQAALADAVMLAVSQRLAPRYVVKPGASSDLKVQVDGVDIPRYAQLNQILEPFGGRLLQADGRTLLYRVSADPAQLKAQLQLAQLHELPPVAAPVDAAAAPVAPGAPAPAPAKTADLHFGW